MWITQEPKKVALWNKWHFEEKNRECAACLKYSVLIFVEKYIKCNIWRVAVHPSYIEDARFLKVKMLLTLSIVPSNPFQNHKQPSPLFHHFYNSPSSKTNTTNCIPDHHCSAPSLHIHYILQCIISFPYLRQNQWLVSTDLCVRFTRC
jgi:hypothetical protein